MYPADAKAMARCPPLLARFGPLAQANKTHEIQTLRNRKTSFGDKASSLDWNLISVHLPDIPFQHPGGGLGSPVDGFPRAPAISSRHGPALRKGQGSCKNEGSRRYDLVSSGNCVLYSSCITDLVAVVWYFSSAPSVLHAIPPQPHPCGSTYMSVLFLKALHHLVQDIRRPLQVWVEP